MAKTTKATKQAGFPLTGAVTVARLASYLRTHGVPVVKVAEGDDCVDASIEVTDRVHVQVGSGYAAVSVETEDDCFEFSPYRTDGAALVEDIRRVLAGTAVEGLQVSIRGARVPCDSLAGASRLWRAYVRAEGIGASEMDGDDGSVYRGSALVATVSYNGRVWGVDGNEIKA